MPRKTVAPNSHANQHIAQFTGFFSPAAACSRENYIETKCGAFDIQNPTYLKQQRLQLVEWLYSWHQLGSLKHTISQILHKSEHRLQQLASQDKEVALAYVGLKLRVYNDLGLTDFKPTEKQLQVCYFHLLHKKEQLLAWEALTPILESGYCDERLQSALKQSFEIWHNKFEQLLLIDQPRYVNLYNSNVRSTLIEHLQSDNEQAVDNVNVLLKDNYIIGPTDQILPIIRQHTCPSSLHLLGKIGNKDDLTYLHQLLTHDELQPDQINAACYAIGNIYRRHPHNSNHPNDNLPIINTLDQLAEPDYSLSTTFALGQIGTEAARQTLRDITLRTLQMPNQQLGAIHFQLRNCIEQLTFLANKQRQLNPHAEQNNLEEQTLLDILQTYNPQQLRFTTFIQAFESLNQINSRAPQVEEFLTNSLNNAQQIQLANFRPDNINMIQNPQTQRELLDRLAGDFTNNPYSTRLICNLISQDKLEPLTEGDEASLINIASVNFFNNNADGQQLKMKAAACYALHNIASKNNHNNNVVTILMKQFRNQDNAHRVRLAAAGSLIKSGYQNQAFIDELRNYLSLNDDSHIKTKKFRFIAEHVDFFSQINGITQHLLNSICEYQQRAINPLEEQASPSALQALQKMGTKGFDGSIINEITLDTIKISYGTSFAVLNGITYIRNNQF